MLYIPKQNLAPVADLMALAATDDLAAEILAQGHNASGKLVASLAHFTDLMEASASAAISCFRYGAIINEGVAPARVAFTIGKRSGVGGARTSKLIEGLMDWIRIRNLTDGTDAQVKGMAFGIATKMKREGSPTKNAYTFSFNGRRKFWIDRTVEVHGQDWLKHGSEPLLDVAVDAFDKHMYTLTKRMGMEYRVLA
jgi:hypothetical protein